MSLWGPINHSPGKDDQNTNGVFMDRVHQLWPQGISVDICSNRWALELGHVRARTAWTKEDDCLAQSTWATEGRETTLFGQPPYSRGSDGPEIAARFAREWDEGVISEALWLVKLDTSTAAWRALEGRAMALGLPGRVDHYLGTELRDDSTFCSGMLFHTRDRRRVTALENAFDGVARIWR